MATAFSRPSNRSGAALAYVSLRPASSWLSRRIRGICRLRSPRIWLPCTIACPNRSPSPSEASAVAVSVWLSLIGSTCCATDTTVSNRVLNSVVTCVASITSELLTRWGDGFLGDENAMYLLPNTVVALMVVSTLWGISLRYLGSTSRVILALGPRRR